MVEHRLKFVALRGQQLLVGVRGHINRLRYIDARACERLRDLKEIPAWRGPITFQRHRDREDRVPGLFRQQHRAHLGDITWTFRTIARERRSTSGSHQSRHFDNGAGAAARARSTHCAVAKSLNETSDVLAVEAARRHDDNATFAPPVSRKKNGVVPEDVNRKAAVLFDLLVVFPADYFETRSESDKVDQEIEREVRGANQQTIFEGIVREVSEFISAIHARVGEILFNRNLHEREEV